MTKLEIIENLWRSPFIDELIRKITSGHQLSEDLKSELFLILMEMPDDRIKAASTGNYLNYLCVSIVKNQYHSSTSPFHKKFRSQVSTDLEGLVISDEEAAECHEEIMNKIKTFINNEIKLTDRELFKLYYKMDRYDRWIGDLRDINCEKPISSTRKIERKLALAGSVPGKRRVSIDHTSVAQSIKRTLNELKNYLKENGDS